MADEEKTVKEPNAFEPYRRKQIAELRAWQSGDDMTDVSVSAEDVKAGSPKPGDMIARNPKNHADQWLVAAAYFTENFEPIYGAEQPKDAADCSGSRPPENDSVVENAACAAAEKHIKQSERDDPGYAHEYRCHVRGFFDGVEWERAVRAAGANVDD